MTRPRCDCGRFAPGKPWEPGDCRRCWLFAHRADYRAAWWPPGRPGPPSPPTPVVLFEGTPAECEEFLRSRGAKPFNPPAGPLAPMTSKPAKRELCLYLGDKFPDQDPRQARCKCRHGCDHPTHPQPFAVPDGVCQTCPYWKADSTEPDSTEPE